MPESPVSADRRSVEFRKRAERDGCGCPDWVLRCAHFEGIGVALVDVERSIRAYPPSDSHQFYEYPHAIVWLPLQPCRRCGQNHMNNFDAVGEEAEGYEDIDAALEAFAEAEEFLLRGAGD